MPMLQKHQEKTDRRTYQQWKIVKAEQVWDTHDSIFVNLWGSVQWPSSCRCKQHSAFICIPNKRIESSSVTFWMCSICDIIVLNAQEADNCKPPPPLPIILYRGQSCCIWFLAASDCASLGGYHNFFHADFKQPMKKCQRWFPIVNVVTNDDKIKPLVVSANCLHFWC